MTDIDKRLLEWATWRLELDDLLQTNPSNPIHDPVTVVIKTEIRLSVPEKLVARVQQHHEREPACARVDLLVRRLKPFWRDLLTYRYLRATRGKTLSESSIAALMGIGPRRVSRELNRAIGWIEAHW